jgi:LemA protein
MVFGGRRFFWGTRETALFVREDDFVIWVVVAVAILVVLALVLVVLYNRLVRLRNRAENAWAQVDVQLQRRHDLIPNLLETVQGYAGHERAVFDEVTATRASAVRATGVEQKAEAENALTAALGRLFAVAEAYPALRATENFQQLQGELAETEDKISVARQIYNDAVYSYDTATETVPTNLVASLLDFEQKRYFEIEDRSRQAPQVSFAEAPSVPGG